MKGKTNRIFIIMLSIWAVCISVGISVLAAPKEEGLALHYDMSRQGGRLDRKSVV